MRKKFVEGMLVGREMFVHKENSKRISVKTCRIILIRKGEIILHFHQKTIDDLFISVGQAVGIHVFIIVLERALWKTRLKYEEAALIEISEDGVLIKEELFEIDHEHATLVVHEFLINIINTLGHLVGKQLAKQLTDQLDVIGTE